MKRAKGNISGQTAPQNSHIAMPKNANILRAVVSQGGGDMFDFLDSADMEKLGGAIEARCKELKIAPDSIEAQMIASQLLDMFQNGVADAEELATRPIALAIIQRHG
ncbi:hypothetical protein P6U16_05645 [Rhizobium sp. 32-5/1]|uniref:hypothetical protein n=1 Tax=Rhizobium sp. 32-5/1 TaxID=3019602 RepID=UPI00240D5719|nr:hypothetical protein [Rhizobium sp. 32-5/1]WEZ84168.1 hypothetical protein P6U16_05645 [Rhizobium sp. 32-5/1]